MSVTLRAAIHQRFESQPDPEREREPLPLRDLESILCVLKVWGLLPMYSVMGTSEIRAATGPWQLYTHLMRAANFAAICFASYEMCLPNANDFFVSYSNLDNVNNMVEMTLCIVGYCVIVGVGARKSSHFIAIVSELLQIDAQLRSRQPLRNHCEFCWKYLLFIALLLAYHFVLSVAASQQLEPELQPTFYLMISLYTLQNTGSAIFILFVAALVQLLTVRFRYLNQLLNAYTAQRRGCRQRSAVCTTERSNDSDSAAAASSSLMAQFPADTAFIYRMHNKLLELYAAINDYANLILVAFFGYSFHTITSTAYNFYLQLRSEDEFSWIVVQWCVVWLVLHVVVMAVLTNRCDRVTKEANNTSVILARVYGKSKEYENIIDKYLTKSIKQDLQFTAYGFFAIDNSTLFKIFSAVTTYLVILIQFKQLEDSKPEDDA